MLKKTITFTNFDGKEVTEDHYFHLSQAELAEMQLSHDGGYDAHLKRIIEAEDGKTIVEEMKSLIEKSYGKKSGDGNRFEKSADLFDRFQSSPAYSVLFMELCTDAEASSAFVNGLLPADLNTQTQKISDKPDLRPVEGGPKGVRAGVRQGDEQPAQEVRVLTKAEALDMNGEELGKLLQTGQARISDDG